MKRLYGTILMIGLISMFGCKKYLDIQPKGKLIPTTPEDVRLLLNDHQTMNVGGGLSELATDNFVLNEIEFQRMQAIYERNTYVWAKDIYSPLDQAIDWNLPYKQIYYSNLSLEVLDKNGATNPTLADALRGEALFFRGYALFEVAKMYAKLYDPATAAAELGVPIRATSDVFEKSDRPSLKETFDQITSDLESAKGLLPEKEPVKTRPTKWAAAAELARVYLYMQDYQKALENATQSLAISDVLLDYNAIDPFGFPLFELFNDEVIFHYTMNFGYAYTYASSLTTAFYDSFEDNDLRKTLWMSSFVDNDNNLYISFNGSYGQFDVFTGLATDEIYLIAAESYARAGDGTNAALYLNGLLNKRYTQGTFTDLPNDDTELLLERIIRERSKELVFRNIRWSDMKRLNTDPRFEITLERTIAGQSYKLLPNDPRYVFPIPQTVIDASGIQQNER